MLKLGLTTIVLQANMAQVDDDSGSLTDMDSRHSLLSSPPDRIADDRKVCSPTCIKINLLRPYRSPFNSCDNDCTAALEIGSFPYTLAK